MRGHDVRQAVQHRVQQRVLAEQVLDGVAGQGQLGHDRDRHSFGRRLARHLDHAGGVAEAGSAT